MNKIRIVLAMLAVMVLAACEQPAAPESEPAELALETTEQRLSYGIAYGLGQRLKQDGVPLDVATFSEGLQHAFEGRTARLTQEEIGAEMTKFQQEQESQMEAEVAEMALMNRAAGEAFLQENGTREGVVTLESGLQYTVVEAGEGAMPGAEDVVEVHYRGTLIDGTEFDSSYSRGETVSFGVNQVIPGWTEALQLMTVGSKWQLFIPSALAYGEGGAGPQIGPNSTLIFDVELISIAAAPAAEE